MATTVRYYFSTGVVGTPTVIGPGWTGTTSPASPATFPLRTSKATDASSAANTVLGGSGTHPRLRAFVSDPLPGGPLAGTVRYVRLARKDVGDDSYLALTVRVVSGDGTTTRGTLLPMTVDTSGIAETGAGSGTYWSRTIEGTLSAVTAQPGDRLVVEVGVHRPGLSTNVTIRENYNNTTADLAYSEAAQVLSLNPWIEFVFTDPPPNPPTGLAQTDATPTTATAGWAAAAGGTAPTSYEVRVDGGAPLDVGLVTSYTLTGRLPSTSATIEVRAVNAAGASAWAGPVTLTTDAPAFFRPWLVSETLLALSGAHPQEDQPAFQWHSYPGPELRASDVLRSRALMGWQITTGRTSPRDKVPPTVVTVTLAAWGEFAAAGLPELGQRFRLALSPVLTALGIAAADLPRFTGEVTDVDLDPTTRVLTVTGVGRYARQGRSTVDGTGWPVEREDARIARILAAIGADPGTLDPGRLDLAPSAVAAAAQLVDTVSNSTTGQLIERRDGALDWHAADHRRDTTTVLDLDASELLRGFRWSQRVGDLTNAADVTWAGGTVHVEDTTSVLNRGAYPTSLDTLLTRRDAAQAVGGLIVGRYGRPVWLLPAVLVDLLRTLDRAELPAGVGLTHGDRVHLTGLPAGGPYTERDAFVEGITETLTPRSWRLTVTTADEQLAGAPIRWRDVPDGVRWTDVSDGLRWLDVATVQDPADLTP